MFHVRSFRRTDDRRCDFASAYGRFERCGQKELQTVLRPTDMLSVRVIMLDRYRIWRTVGH